MTDQIGQQIPSCAYEIWQGGVMVASVHAADEQRAWDEAWHYAMQYAQDGDVEIHAVEADG